MKIEQLIGAIDELLCIKAGHSGVLRILPPLLI
jgi:hypothetical protein